MARTDGELNSIIDQILGSAIAVHGELGPGLLRSAYEACMLLELGQRGLAVEKQKEMPVVYRNTPIDCGYKIDLLVEGKVILELMAVDEFHPVHEAQLLTYLKLSGCKAGLLINFNVKVLRNGIKKKVVR